MSDKENETNYVYVPKAEFDGMMAKVDELYTELMKGNRNTGRKGKVADIDRRLELLENAISTNSKPLNRMTPEEIDFFRKVKNIVMSWKVVAGMAVVFTGFMISLFILAEKVIDHLQR